MTDHLDRARIARRVIDELDPAALAAETARLVLDELKPGCGSLIVPQWAADVFAEIGSQFYISRQQLVASGPNWIGIEAVFRPGGTLMLALEVNGQHRAWEGVLRGPGGP